MYEHDIDSHADMRVGDSERETTANRIREAHAEGRLDVEEFQQRLDGCYAAKTAGELRALVADLPGDRGDRQRFSPFAFAGRRGLFGWPAFPIIPILLVLIVISASVHGHFLWIIFPLFFLSRWFLWGPRYWARGRRWGARSWDR
jgi:hypothetical protein